MFGPVRGPWPDDSWKGWWGDNPPYHVPVFVLTHHARAPLTMEGGTTFHFVTDGIHSALQQAVAAANGKDVRLGGGASTIQQYLRAGLIDEMHLVSSPVLIGRGESIFRDLDLPALGYQLTHHIASPNATHMFLARKNSHATFTDPPGHRVDEGVSFPLLRMMGYRTPSTATAAEHENNPSNGGLMPEIGAGRFGFRGK